MAVDISLTWVDVAACLAEKYGKRAFAALADLCADDVAADEIVRLRAVLDAIDALHTPSLGHQFCYGCFNAWPCPTHLLIHPEEEA